MKLDTLTIFFIVLLAVVALFVFSSCTLSCNSSTEGYWSLPFGGGDVRTYAPDPHRIEGPLGRALDESDMGEGDSGDYPM